MTPANLFWCLTALAAITLIDSTESLNILGLFPHPGISHSHFFRPIMRALAEKGHHVTLVSHFPDSDPHQNYKDVPITKNKPLTNTVNISMIGNRTKYRYFQEFFDLYSRGMRSCELALNSTAMQKLINRKQKFDVILVEQYSNDCMMGVAWKLDAPVIGLSSCALMPWHYDRVSNPLVPSYIPSLFLGLSDNMSYAERLVNWVSVNALKLMYKYITLRKNDEITRKYIRDENMPYLEELVKKTSMLFVNTHYSFSGSRPTAPTVIELGGIHIKEKAKPLDAELQKYLDSAKDGVIYVSWGSVLRAATMPTEKRNSFLKALASFKQKVLWKWENESLPNQPKNVLIRKWMPQRDILCHPNVRVFVSHGGLFGSSEAAYCGVPMVLTPMHRDQFQNAKAAESRGMGSIVHWETISEETIKNAITEALKPESVKNAKEVSYSYKNRPTKAVDEAVWWTEYVAATRGAPLLQSNSMHLSAIAYYSLDIYATIAATVFIVVSLLLVVFVKCCKKASHKKSKTA